MTNSPGITFDSYQVIGQPASDLSDKIRLIDDAESIARAVERIGFPLAGAFVPVCLHEPSQSQQVYDSAEAAAGLLAAYPGIKFVAVPFIPRLDDDILNEGTEPLALQTPSWNHAIALARRLRIMVERYGLAFHLEEEVDGTSSSEFDAKQSINYVLDTAGLRRKGWVARRLTPGAEPVIS